MTTGMRWYIVNVYSGFEDKVVQGIREQAEKKSLGDAFGEILVPKEEVVEIKKGEKVTTQQKFFPGYILVQMLLTDDTWHLVKNTPKVSTFLGAKGKPMPIAQKEVDRIVAHVEERHEAPRVSMNFEIGEQVRVSDGPFSTFTGVVEDVKPDKSRLKVLVSIFGRATPVDLDFSQVEKI